MPAYHAISANHPGQYLFYTSDAQEPPAAPEGWQVATGRPDGLSLYHEPSLTGQLSAVFEGQSDELQADFAPLRAAVHLELNNNRPNIAKKIIERAQVPAELETVRQQMLGLFP